MTKISQYSTDVNITGNDKWIGSDAQNFLITKNFTPNNLASFFNENNVIDIGTSIRYRYQTLLPGEAREQGTISFETEIGPQVNFSAITTFLIAKNTLKGNTVTQYLDFLVDGKVLLSKASNINIFGYYKITSIEPWIPNTNFFVVEVDFLAGNGFISEDLDYLVSLVDKVQDIPPPVWGSITGDIEDQTDLIDYISSQITTPTLQSVLTAGREFDETTGNESSFIKESQYFTDRYRTIRQWYSIVDDLTVANTSFDTKEIHINTLLYQSDLWNNSRQLGIQSPNPSVTDNSRIYTEEKQNETTSDNSAITIEVENIDETLNTATNYIFKQKAVNGDYEVATTDDLITPTLQEVTDEGNVVTSLAGATELNGGVINISNADNTQTTSIGPNVVQLQNSDNNGFALFYSNSLSISESGFQTSVLPASISFAHGYFGTTTIYTNTTKDPLIEAVITLPNESGTLALLSDITGGTLQDVVTAGNTYTGTNSVVTILDGQISLTGQTGGIYDGYDNTLGNDVLQITNPYGIAFYSTNSLDVNDNLNNRVLLSANNEAKITLVKEGIFTNISSNPATTSEIFLLTPETSGTLALTSDIPAAGVTSVGLTMPSAFTVTNSPITSSGDIAVTGAGTASQYVRGDGQLATFPSGGGGGSSVNYYLNGSIAASVATYQQMSNTAIIGAGTDFPLTGNGLIAQFLTDVGNPNRLEIPGGAWNFEMFFSMSSNGGTPKFYVELLKYDGAVFTSISSSSAVPENITGGTSIDLYLTSLAVPTTPLLVTDRLAIRVYIVGNSGGRTATLHTEDNHLCEIITTFSGGVTSLNGLTANTQYFDEGTTGTDFNISSTTDTHTFNLPTASATNRGALSSANWSTFNAKPDLGLVQAMTQGLQNIF